MALRDVLFFHNLHGSNSIIHVIACIQHNIVLSLTVKQLSRSFVITKSTFHSVTNLQVMYSFPIPQDWVPNTRLIIEGLCNNLSAQYPFLRNCGLQKLDIYCLFAFEAVASNVIDPDQSLLPMQWESVERTVSGIREGYQFHNGCIGVRISVGNSSVDLVLEVVGSAQHLNPGE